MRSWLYLKVEDHQSYVMDTEMSVGPAWWLWWLHGYAEDHRGTELVTWVGWGPSECCDGYRGKMRTARM